MKVREQRKQRVREKSNRKLSSELFALTIGVCLNWKKIKPIIIVKHPPNTENVTSSIPISSLNVKYSVFFKSHRVLSSFDLNSGGQDKHVTASERTKTLNVGIVTILRYLISVASVTFPQSNINTISVKDRSRAVSLVVLLNSPSAQRRQSKQQMGFPFTNALRVPGRQLSLQMDLGT